MFLFFRKGAFPGFLFLFLSLSGCASFDSTDYAQTVLVTSEPAGALIYDRGEQIGVTPAYVRVRRRMKPEITVQYPGQLESRVPLNTRYRWGDSFGINFLFTAFAPVGWGVDLLTGVAWKMDDPPVLKLNGKAQPTAEPEVVAIGPPQPLDAESADALGVLLESKVASLGVGQVLPYRNTVRLFEYYGSDHGLTRNPKQRYNLFYQLKANEIFISQAEPSANGYIVNGHLHDVFTGVDRESHSWEITSSDGNLKEELTAHRFFSEYFHFFPNTAFLNLAPEQPALNIDKATYNGRSARGNSVFDETLNLVGFVGLAHMERPRADIKGHLTFDFVPTINVSQKKIYFDDYTPVKGTQFERFYASAGYGMEVGNLSRYGFFYFDLIPTPAWTDIRTSSPSREDRISRLSVTLMYELGYSKFVTDHLVAKIFARGINEDNALWAQAIHGVSGRDENIQVNSQFAGVALGYYIPSSLNRKNNWRAVEKH